MMGILCGAGGEMRFAKGLQKILKQGGCDRPVSVIVFSMPNINLIEKTVYGNLVSKDAVNPSKTDLPLLIFNFAVQNSRKNIKKLRNLMEVENLTLLNPANSFNQWSIMKMLSSGPLTLRYVLPYQTIAEKNDGFSFQRNSNFIVKPQNGSSVSKMIYGRKTGSGYDLYYSNGISRSHLSDLKSAVLPEMTEGKWMTLSVPDLVTYHNRLLVIRGYLHKDTDGKWKIVSKSLISHSGRVYRNQDAEMNQSLLRIINTVNCFIKDLIFCSVDLVMGRNGSVYFLNLGGWQNLISEKRQRRVLLESLCQSISAYDNPLLQHFQLRLGG